MKRHIFSIGCILVVLQALFVCSMVSAKEEPKFEFVYQKVTAIDFKDDSQESTKWWEKVLDIGKKVVDRVEMVVDQAKMRFFPGNFSGTVRSTQTDKLSYKVERVKVTSEAQLLELMGVKNGDLSTLTNGQRGLLEAYRYSKSQAVKELSPYGYRKETTVLLTDLTEGEKIINNLKGDKKALAESAMSMDFWPMSLGSIQLNSDFFDTRDWKNQADGTFMHEYAHTLDRAIPAGLLDEGVKTYVKQGGFLYGRDNMHYLNERTTARVAFMEGWAEFNELCVTGKADTYRNLLKNVEIEDRKGNYTTHPSESLSGKDLLAVEGINALIMYDIAASVPDGKTKLCKAFASSNQPFHSLKNLLREFVKKNPDQAAAVLSAVDKNTFGRLSDSELKSLVGSSKGVDEWLKMRRSSNTTGVASYVASYVEPITEVASEAGDTGVSVSGGEGGNPFTGSWVK